MKGCHWLLIGLAAGVAGALLVRRWRGTGGIGAYSVPAPNQPWFNLPSKPLSYKAVGWQPPSAWEEESKRLAKQFEAQGMGEYPVAMSPFAMPSVPTSQMTYLIEKPIEWMAPGIDPKYLSPEAEPF